MVPETLWAENKISYTIEIVTSSYKIYTANHTDQKAERANLHPQDNRTSHSHQSVEEQPVRSPELGGARWGHRRVGRGRSPWTRGGAARGPWRAEGARQRGAWTRGRRPRPRSRGGAQPRRPARGGPHGCRRHGHGSDRHGGGGSGEGEARVATLAWRPEWGWGIWGCEAGACTSPAPSAAGAGVHGRRLRRAIP